MATLLSVENLSVDFRVGGSWLPAVSGVSFQVERGEILALVGESGCGKSVTCLSLARLVAEPAGRYVSGKVNLAFKDGIVDVLALPPRRLREVRGSGIAYIFQEPSVSLNPVFRVGDQIAEAVVAHRPEVLDVDAEVAGLLQKVGIPEPVKRARCYPHELSGGMAQRVMIAMALACHPRTVGGGRADDGPGRDHPGADTGSAAGPSRPARYGDHHRDAQFWHRGGAGRQGGCDVRRADRGGGFRRRACAKPPFTRIRRPCWRRFQNLGGRPSRLPRSQARFRRPGIIRKAVASSAAAPSRRHSTARGGVCAGMSCPNGAKWPQGANVAAITSPRRRQHESHQRRFACDTDCLNAHEFEKQYATCILCGQAYFLNALRFTNKSKQHSCYADRDMKK